MSLVAIHQPNFFPWLGYFDKIRRCDDFVFLDAVALPNTSRGSYTNRVRIDINCNARWIACPVARDGSTQLIGNVIIDDRTDWRGKILGSIEVSYLRAPSFHYAMPVIERLMRFETSHLADFNIHVIRQLSEILGLKARFIRQSTLNVKERATDLLIEIAKRVGAQSYLCGGGAQGYQDDALFSMQGIKLIYQGFVPRHYGDASRFIPGLSVIDYLMHVPPDRWKLDF